MPTEPPSDESRLVANLPAFLPPRQSPPSRRQPPSTTKPESPDVSPVGPDAAGSASAGVTSEKASGPSPGSTSHPPGWLDGGLRKAYEKSAKTVARAAGALIDMRAGSGTGGFLMQPSEAQDIAEPASRLLARHTPAAGTGRITDVGDVVELIVATFGYLMNGLTRRQAGLVAPDTTAANWVEPTPTEPEPAAPGAPTPAWPTGNLPPMIGSGG
jgi:hypothetical protein